MRSNGSTRETQALAARLRRVEQELADLKAALTAKAGKRWYREIVGSFAGDKTHMEIVRLGGLIRQGRL